jgi:xanthine dehydrogenase YagT iron-sulfur-binding subunit
MSTAPHHSSLVVNGERRDVLAPASTTLLEVLRGPLELTGTKRGCNHGVCGARWSRRERSSAASARPDS